MRKLTLICAISALASSLLIACQKSGSSYGKAEAAVDTIAPETGKEAAVDTIAPETEKSEYVSFMSAKGHDFRYCYNDSISEGWYYDNIYLGNHDFLRYDSVGPSTLRLSIITKEATIDLGDPRFVEKARDLMKPLEGFRSFQKRYAECLGTVKDEHGDPSNYMGQFSFVAHYAGSKIANARKINSFIVSLMDRSEIDKELVGSNTTRSSGPYNITSDRDLTAITDAMAYNLFEHWRHDFDEDYGIGATGKVLAIKPHIANDRYVTFGKYDHDYSGQSHGMYTQTFHTFDIKTGKELTNKDIFESQYLTDVKDLLKDIMSKDPYYLSWHEEVKSSKDVTDFYLSDGALTESGVVFSFQPYEIDCWAAGAYHFIVPYNQLMPFLTPKTKNMISTK